MSAKVIGIDPSITATGLCDVVGRLSVAGGPPHMGDRRLVIIEHAVLAMVENDPPDLAVIEFLPQHMKAAGITGLVQGVIRSVLIKNLVQYVMITPATLKKFATGRGDADKADMRMAMFRRTGQDIAARGGGDDMVDAWWLRTAGLQALGEPVVDMPQANVRALETVGWPHLAEADET